MQPPAWAPSLASAALVLAKSTLLLAGAAAGARALRRGSAAARYLVWALSLAGLVVLPALVRLVPRWQPGLLAFLSPAPHAAAGGAALAAGGTEAGVSPVIVVLAVWAAGAMVVLARLAFGLAAARRLARGAEVVDDAEWTELLERVGRAMGVRRAVSLLRSAEASMPLTWGAFHPSILLPAEADAWPEPRRRVVLLHELAHVARRDCLAQTLAEVCCALWWFHPGAWWAARQMRVEREQACDDRVLAAGARASDYAGHLLDVARAYRAPSLAAAIAMARPSQLEGRVRAVLEAERDRRAVTRRTGGICAAAVLLAALPLAAVSPSPRRAAPAASAWELPPARSGTPFSGAASSGEFRIAARVTPAPGAADAPQTGVWRWTPKTRTPARAAHPSSSAHAPARVAPVAQVARAAARGARRARTVPARLVARLDAGGTVRLAVRDGRGSERPGVRLKMESHGGVTSAAVEIRLDPELRALVEELAAADTSPGREKAPRSRAARKLTAAARRAVREQPRGDLALRVLRDLNVQVQAADGPAGTLTGGA